MTLLAVSAPAAIAAPKDDRAIARQAVLKIDDLPPGWRSAKNAPDEDLSAYEDIRECERLLKARLQARRLPKAGTTFKMGENGEITNDVGAYRSVRAADRVMQLWRAPSSEVCVQKALAKVIEERLGAGIGPSEDIDDVDVEFGQLSIEPVGDDSVGHQLVVTVKAEGVSIDFYLDSIFVRVGRYLSNFSFEDLFSPITATDAIIDRVIERLQDAAT